MGTDLGLTEDSLLCQIQDGILLDDMKNYKMSEGAISESVKQKNI